MKFLKPFSLLAAASLLAACAHAPPDDPRDPIEPFNRAMFSFNRTADKYVLRPVASGYQKITPEIAQRGFSNFFDNLDEPRTIINDLLQIKVVQAASDTGRFLLNTTAGLAGFLDVATGAGLPKHDEDFGQTLGHYGIGEGWYLMLPLLGPTSNRDFIGRVGDYPTGPTAYIQNPGNYVYTGTNLVDKRARFLSADSVIDNAIDPYVFVRTAYLQQRLSKVYDGSPPAKLMYGDGSDEDAP